MEDGRIRKHLQELTIDLDIPDDQEKQERKDIHKVDHPEIIITTLRCHERGYHRIHNEDQPEHIEFAELNCPVFQKGGDQDHGRNHRNNHVVRKIARKVCHPFYTKRRKVRRHQKPSDKQDTEIFEGGDCQECDKHHRHIVGIHLCHGNREEYRGTDHNAEDDDICAQWRHCSWTSMVRDWGNNTRIISFISSIVMSLVASKLTKNETKSVLLIAVLVNDTVPK